MKRKFSFCSIASALADLNAQPKSISNELLDIAPKENCHSFVHHTFFCRTLSGIGLTGSPDNSEEHSDWLWKLKCGEKIKTFLWLIMNGRYLTNVERAKRHLTNDMTVQSVAKKTKLSGTCSKTAMARNEVVFRGREKELFLTVRRGRENALEARVLTKHGGVDKALSKWIRWTLSSPIWVKLNTSSSAKKSMGMAFVGGKLQDCEGWQLLLQHESAHKHLQTQRAKSDETIGFSRCSLLLPTSFSDESLLPALFGVCSNFFSSVTSSVQNPFWPSPKYVPPAATTLTPSSIRPCARTTDVVVPTKVPPPRSNTNIVSLFFFSKADILTGADSGPVAIWAAKPDLENLLRRINELCARAFHGYVLGTAIATDVELMSTVLMISPTLSMDLLQELRLKVVNKRLTSSLFELFKDLLQLKNANRELMSTLLKLFTELLHELLLTMRGESLSNLVVDSVKATDRSIS
nr:LINE-type retrotransposon LIb DNA [Ipomoea batatas]